MSYENRGKTISLVSDAVYADRYIPVKKTSTSEQFTVCGAGDVPVGILQDPIEKIGQAGCVMINGVSFAIASAAIAAGASVATAAGGKVVTAAGGVTPFGIALNAATAEGDIISVLLTTAGNPAAALLTLNYTSSDLAAGADIASAILGACAFGGSLVDAKIISTGAPSGIDADNTSVFEIKVGSTVKATITFDAETAFPAAGVAIDIPIVSAAVAADAILTLSVTNGTTADLPIFVVQATII